MYYYSDGVLWQTFQSGQQLLDLVFYVLEWAKVNNHLLLLFTHKLTHLKVYTAGSAYAVDSVPGKGASVTAACNLFRMTMAAILSMVSPIMGSELSIGHVSILLASLNVVGMCLLVYVKYKGVHLRRRAGLAKYK